MSCRGTGVFWNRWFIGFNAKEDDLAGSKDYVDNRVITSGENIVGMINMDMILRPGSDVDPTPRTDSPTTRAVQPV